MMNSRASEITRLAAMVLALTMAWGCLFCAPAQAFDPGAFDPPAFDGDRQSGPERSERRARSANPVMPQGMLPPGHQSGRSLLRGIPPESGLPRGMKPGDVPPAMDDRAPSGLFPDDDQDRRALQQMMGHDRARAAVQTGTIRSLTEIRSQIRRRFDGRIVGVELYENRMGAGPDWVYDVRVLNPRGNVVAVEMDARTGRVMAVRGMR